jgi:intracellular septation protein
MAVTPEETATKSREPQVKGSAWIKLALELGPLMVFFLAYNQGDAIGAWLGYPDMKPIIVATVVFIPTMIVSVLGSFWLTKEVAVMPLVSLVLVCVFGGLTIWLNDETFIKMKPTILNVIFAVVLMAGLAYGKLFLKLIFQEGWSITDTGWRLLTIRWSIFFVCMAILNEVIWRNFSEDFWVNFKVWGNLPITMIFAVFQMRLVFQHPLPENEEEAA